MKCWHRLFVFVLIKSVVRMEQISHELQVRLERLRSGPILYRGDPDIPTLLSAELADFAKQGVPESLLRTNVDTFLQLYRERDQESVDLYQRSLAQLRNDVLNSLELQTYKASPSGANLNALVDKFEAEAPRSTVLRVAGLNEFHSILLSNTFSEFTSEQHRQLAECTKKMVVIDIDQADLQTQVSQAQALVDSLDNIVMQWVIVVGFTPEGFSLRVPEQPLYDWDRTLTGLVFAGLRQHMPPNVQEWSYFVWWTQLFNYLTVSNSQYLTVLMAAFPRPAEEVLRGSVPPELDDVVQIAGEAFAALCTVFTTEAVQQMILPRLAHMYIDALSPESQPFDMPFRRWAWSMLPSLSDTAQGTFESIARWINVTKKLSTQWAAPVKILSPFFSLFYTTSIALYEFIDKLIELLIYGLDKFAGPFTQWLKEYLYIGRAWTSVVLPGARRRPKSVWALLFANDFTRMDPGTRFAMSCQVMEKTPSPNFDEWQQRFQSAINDTKLADYELYPVAPLRPLRLPNNPMTIDEEILALAPLFPGQARKTDIMDEMLEKWIQYNVPQGIDGQWFATPDRVAQSILRYDVDRVEADEHTTGLVRRTAYALLQKYPEMYGEYKYFTPAHAMRRLKWDTNMSPGLGFMGNVRTRKLLRRHGFLDAIQKVAIDRLNQGIHPGTVAHAFVKEQVVSLEKLIQGKNIRTVIAMDLMANTLALPFSIELSRAPPPEAYVLNALPRSEGGYRPIFEDLRNYALVLQADASEFDSKLGPAITVEGLGELRSLSFAANPAIDIITSQIKAHYFHMRHANVVDLTTGTVFNKTGGLMTGQVNTSYDNRDAFRIMIIAAWAHVTKRDPSEFWDDSILGNAGDDDVIGSNLSRETWMQIFSVCKDLFGVTVNLEEEGWNNLSITALQPVAEQADTAYYRMLLGMPQVDFGIRTEPAKLLLAKTEFRARVSRLSDIPFRQAHVDTMVGTAYLSAYNPEIYHDLAELYLADMKYILLRFYSKVNIEEHRDRFGHLSNLKVTGSSIRPRYKRVEHKIDTMINAWLKKVQWPSYQRVFNIWVRPYSVDRSNIAKHYRTLVSGGPALPVANKLLYGLVGFREALYTIPNHVVRALPEFPGADVSVTLKTPEFIVERFVWSSVYHKRRSIPTKQMFLQALREGPYAAATSPLDFLEHIENEEYMVALLEFPLETLRAQAIAVTLVYSLMEKLLNMAAQTPLLGIPISLYAISTRDVNRLYATANHVYWLAEGRSSSIISNLMPADPYAWMKQLSVILVSGIPERWIEIPGLRHLVNWAPSLVEAWVLMSATTSPNVARSTFRHPPMNTPWASVLDGILSDLADGFSTSSTIVAPTGSGKSTLFIAALTVILPKRRIWLLHPTKLARDQNSNDFLPTGQQQVLERGIQPRPDVVVFNVTYGYFVQILPQVLETDIVVYDEVHLSVTEMWVAWCMVHNNLKLALTATPKWSIQPKTHSTHVYPGTRRFKMKMTYVNQTFEQLWTTLTRSYKHLLSRALIICPTVAQATFVRNTLDRMSYASSLLSAETPDPAPSGIIVATSIADQAVTIMPPPTTVIDLGTTLKITVQSLPGQLFPVASAKIEPVSQELADQRAGRGGRQSDSEGFGLLNSPRTAFAAPPRFPTSVFMAEEAVPALLAIFQLRNPLQRIHDIPGLLQFVSINMPTSGTVTTHTVACALVAILYMSSGSDLELFKNDCYNAKYASVVSDELRVYSAQTSLLLPDSEPLLGELLQVESLLLSGLFEVFIDDKPYPVAAFLFVEGWLMPVGQPLNILPGIDLIQALPHSVQPVTMTGVTMQLWPQLYASIVLEGLIEAKPTTTIQPLFMFTQEQCDLPAFNRAPAWVAGVFASVRRSKLMSSRVKGHLRVAIDNMGALVDQSYIRVSTNNAFPPLRGVLHLSIADLGFNIRAAAPLVMLLACEAADDQRLTIGSMPPHLYDLRIRYRNHVLIRGSPTDPSMFSITAPIARRFVAIAAQGVITGSLVALKQTCPIVLLEDNLYFQEWQDQGWLVTAGTVISQNLHLA